MSSKRTRRKPRQCGSIRNEGLSSWELMEYLHTGAIRAKEPPAFSVERSAWPYGCYRSINIKEMLGGEELVTWDPALELAIIARVIMTEYGIIGMEDKGSHYLLDVADRSCRSSVIRDLEWNGCRARIVPGGFICVIKERLVYEL